METLKTRIENAASTQELELIVESMPKRENNERSKLSRILDDAFWYIDLTTVEQQKAFMLKIIEAYPIEAAAASKNLIITDLELLVISKLKDADDFEDMPTDCIENLVDNTGLTAKVLRGVLSSLIQKDIVWTGEYPNGLTAFHYKGF
jgi:hypothetical protein